MYSRGYPEMGIAEEADTVNCVVDGPNLEARYLRVHETADGDWLLAHLFQANPVMGPGSARGAVQRDIQLVAAPPLAQGSQPL